MTDGIGYIFALFIIRLVPVHILLAYVHSIVNMMYCPVIRNMMECNHLTVPIKSTFILQILLLVLNWRATQHNPT